jgi:hypothetical protein
LDPNSSSVSIGPNAAVAVKVANVGGLYTWQIRLSFNGSLVNCTGAWYPDNQVFANKTFIPVTPLIERNSITFGASIVGSGQFDGSGTLCLINFTGLSEGSCPLQFDVEGTFILNADLNTVQITTNQGMLTVANTDINRDGRVDMRDIALVSHAFGTIPGNPNWNPACDMNHDNKIDMKDVALVAHDFGRGM